VTTSFPTWCINEYSSISADSDTEKGMTLIFLLNCNRTHFLKLWMSSIVLQVCFFFSWLGCTIGHTENGQLLKNFFLLLDVKLALCWMSTALSANYSQIHYSHVVDLWHFGTDLDPWIHTTDLQIWILLILSVADKILTKKCNKFSNILAHYVLKVHLHQSSKIKRSQKEVNK